MVDLGVAASKQNCIYKVLGASNHTDKERQNEDFYATDPIAIDALIKDGKAEINHYVWECACGTGCLSNRLEEYGHAVWSTDLIDRDYGLGGVDFLSYNDKWHGDIVTNPPYKYAKEFIEHGLEVVEEGNKVFMFLKVQFLEGKARKKLFEKKQLRTVYVSSSRILCAKNAQFAEMRERGGTAMAHAWFEFQKGYNGDPVLKWIN